jgi:flagellar assembly protein FliH
MSSSTGVSGATPFPVSVLQYRDMSDRSGHEVAALQDREKHARNGDTEVVESPRFSAQEMTANVERAWADGAADAERRLRADYEQKLAAARAPLAKLISTFEEQKNDYFARVEAEVVQLALSIASKILHREAQVDPMLVAALVRMALEKMREGSAVLIRVGIGRAEYWRRYFATVSTSVKVEVAEDPQLGEHDCLVETELGSADFGLDSQLKEVEQGFLDLLALRPSRS